MTPCRARYDAGMARRPLALLARVALVGILLAGCAADVRAHAVTHGVLLRSLDRSVIVDAVGEASATTSFSCEVMGSMGSSTEESTPDD